MQKKNGLTELRANLFTVMEKLMDEENPMEIERAKAIANVGQTIINSANARSARDQRDVDRRRIAEEVGVLRVGGNRAATRIAAKAERRCACERGNPFGGSAARRA